MPYIESAGSLSQFPHGADVVATIPAGVWKLRFSKERGNYLIPVENTSSGKLGNLYGDHERRARKAVAAYQRREGRPTGVLLTGTRGSGKSVTQLLISRELAEQGIPTIIIDKDIPGITTFLDGVEQDAVVIFDEFEKSFESRFNEHGESVGLSDSAFCSQEELLTLFDGITGRHHLYVLAMNEVEPVTPFIFARPGRFRYRFNYSGLTPAVVKEYLSSEAPSMEESDILRLQVLALASPLTFDMLAVIVEDFNAGFSILESIQDINLVGKTKRDHKHSEEEQKRIFPEPQVHGLNIPEKVAATGVILDTVLLKSLSPTEDGRLKFMFSGARSGVRFSEEFYFSLKDCLYEDSSLVVPWDALKIDSPLRFLDDDDNTVVWELNESQFLSKVVIPLG